MSASSFATAPALAAGLPAPRAFGTTLADLDLDFGRSDRPALTTSVLATCCAGESLAQTTREEIAWGLPLGARIAGLLRIVQLTLESDALAAVLTCPQSSCGNRFEVALPFAAILAESSVPADGQRIIPFPTPQAGTLALRLPTGRDQARWRGQPYATAERALAEIVHSLALDPASVPKLEGAELEPLAAAMEAADPLVAFSVRTTCPHCANTSEINIDLEAIALEKLAQFRRGLLRSIHALATRYGWSEADILAIPPGRRAEYRRMIEDENPDSL